MRADEFILKHCQYLSGKLYVINDINDIAADLSSQVNSPIHIHNEHLAPIKENNNLVNNAYENKNDSPDFQCPACARGNKPSGAHTCIVCKESVHPFLPCSLPIPGQEEGYGELRVCRLCNENSPNSAENILSANVQEDWKGLLSKNNKKKKSLYLQPLHSRTAFIDIARKEIPIIKNANRPELKAILLENKKITLRNTCAFDSLLQIMLVGFLDYSDIETYLKNNREKVLLFDMIIDIAISNITADSYKKRCKILAQHCQLQNVVGKNYILKCDSTAGILIKKLFHPIPSFIESKLCKNNCKIEDFNIIITHVGRHTIKENLGNSITSFVVVENERRCTYCNGLLTTKIKPGTYILCL